MLSQALRVMTRRAQTGAHFTSSMYLATVSNCPASAKNAADGTAVMSPVCSPGRMSAVSSGTGV